jgi:hypothetical protein
MQTLRSGIKRPDGTDNATRANNNENLDTIDKMIRDDYREKVDITTWDATAKIYTKVEYFRPESNTLYLQCTLSGKNASGFFVTDTWKFYDAAGTTVVRTVTWTLTYDTSGNVIDKVPAVS